VTSDHRSRCRSLDVERLAHSTLKAEARPGHPDAAGTADSSLSAEITT
jgi:hypothetical protein